MANTLFTTGKSEDMDCSIKWALEYIEAFKANHEFDPFDSITGTESTKQKLFCLCVEYLYNLDELTENFRKNRKQIVFVNK